LLAELASLLAALDALPSTAGEDALDRSRPLVLARAPGRLDLMGGIADYSGSLTLELPIREATFAAVQERGDGWVQLTSLDLGARRSARHARLPASDLRDLAGDYASARAYFARPDAERWPAYIAGALTALQHDFGVELRQGSNIVVASSVPEGMGVSSSAAVEVATLKALAALFQREISAHELALACQRVENLVVGAACGVMDQMTASAGKEGHVLELLCQPATIQGRSRVPSELAVWGIDSGLRHAVSGADYTAVRVAAFMGYRMISEQLGLEVEPGSPGRVTIRDPRYRGYLANLDAAEFERDLRALLPEQLSGAEFLARYGGITDTVTQVDPHRTYPIQAATAHPVHEHARTSAFRDTLPEGGDPAAAARLGELMYAAHASYSACGLGSSGTDLIVELVRRRGPERGFYGAKITGGGSGGTVAVLTRAGASGEVEALAADYAARTGHQPHLFWGSSPGAAEFGLRAASASATSGWQIDGGSPRGPRRGREENG
jgi:L-arabinokinase